MDVLYTTYPLDMVLEENKENQITLKNISYQGIEMQVEPLEFNKFRIVRLYSTDPQDYLDANLQPGSIISI
ncbi:MAG: YlzJ-like family protein [Peptococcales bacterium]|jgi:hypothetical protein